MNPVRAMRLLKERMLAGSTSPRTFVAVAGAALPDVRELVGGRHPVFAVPNAIDTERFRLPSAEERASARRSLGAGEDDRIVLFLGHEFVRKGLLELIEAMQRLPVGFRLLVAGGASQDVPRFESAARSASVADRVRFLGEVTDVPTLLAGTDVFCIPSHYETMPMVALEALACGVPTVVSEHCPARSFVTPGRTGEICAVESSSIAEAVSAAARLEPGPAIRQAVQGADWSTATERYLAVLRAFRAVR